MVEASPGDAARTVNPGTAVPPRGLPSGMVTFVFTDIEGSTRLLRRWGSHYEELLERHRDILRAAWSEHGGWEIGTEGDAFFVAFQRADDAIEACAAAQRGLLAESWPKDGVVRVRMGVHCGLAWPREDNYVALAVHQAARVVDAAHGGQVIATSDAAERAGIPVRGDKATASSPGSPACGDVRTELLALGRFRIRDFDEPVQILQVVGPGIPAEFPSLRVLPADRHNLVVPPNELFGRETDLSELKALISKSNLVTLVGPGGVGKTRLATEFGLRHATEWADGAWLVDLTGVRDGLLVPEAIAEAIGVRAEGDTEPWDAIIDHLRARHVLLVVDNCEHLRVDVARRLSELLHECPGVSVIATSREPLGLREERVCRTEPIAVESAAVAMFAQRAGLAEELGDLDLSTRTTLEELCRVLDGLPLAIELAASRCDVLSPSEILKQLKNQRSLLRSRDPTLAERQRSMEATIEWSHQLLDGHEQTAFRRLGVFADGFDLNAATVAVVGGTDAFTVTDDGLSAYDVPELVWSLASKSLVTSEVASGTTRYRMLETIRAYSKRLLDHSDDTSAVAADVGAFYLESFGPHLTKFDASVIADRAREVNNLRALISMLATSDPELAQTLACVVVADVRQTSFRAALEEGRGFLEQLAAPTQGRVSLLNNVAFILNEAQLPEQASVLISEAESLAAAVGLPPWLEGRLEQERGIVEIIRGNPGRAREIALEGLTRTTSDRARANLLELLLFALIDLGDYRAAIEAGGEALAISQERGDLEIVSLLLSSLAEASWRLGDHPAAAGRQLESLSLGMQTGRRRDIAYACIMGARLAGAQGDYVTATRLQSAADRLLDEAGASLYPADAALRLELIEACRDRLGDEGFSLELAAGAALEIQEAVGVARRHLKLVAGV